MKTKSENTNDKTARKYAEAFYTYAKSATVGFLDMCEEIIKKRRGKKMSEDEFMTSFVLATMLSLDSIHAAKGEDPHSIVHFEKFATCIEQFLKERRKEANAQVR